MAKRFIRQPACSESDDAGCFSGFVSIFDFHVGRSSQKLLSDKKRGNNLVSATGCSREKLDFPSNFEMKLEDVDVNSHKGDDERREKGDKSAMLSFKTLMDEEMSKTKHTQIQNSQLEQSRSASRSGIHLREKNKKKSKKCSVVPDHHVNDLRCSSNSDFGQYNSTNAAERSSASYDLAAFMAKFRRDKHQNNCQADSDIDLFPLSERCVNQKKLHLDETDYQLSENYFTLQKVLSNVASFLKGQNLADSKEPARKMSVQSREFIDALEILSSNMDLMVKLIQDPNSHILKHIQGIQDALIQSEILGEEISFSECFQNYSRNEPSQKQNHRSFLIKNDKSRRGSSSEDTRKIVLLKPNSTRNQNDSIIQTPSSSPFSCHSSKHLEESERFKSYFSLKGIKRRLIHVIGENRKVKHPISMDGLLDRSPYGIKDSVDSRENPILVGNASSISQETSQLSAVGKKNNTSNLKIGHSSCFNYEEAKKHLIDMVELLDDKYSSTAVSNFLERVVPLSEYNFTSPRFSQGSDNELMFSPEKTLFCPSCQLSPVDYLSPLRECLDQDAKTHVTESNRECIAADLMPKGDIEVVDESDIKSLKEDGDLDRLADQAVICEGCKEEGSSALQQQEMSNGSLQLRIPSLSTPPNFLYIDKIENLDGMLEKPERPSPVSVLEPFLEDFSSPGSTTSDHVALPLQPQQIDFQEHDDFAVDFEGKETPCFDGKEAIYDFIAALLQAAGMDCYQILGRWNSSDEFLDPTLLEEVGILHTLLPGNSGLMFNCINEVLAEIHERLFGCTAWVSLIKPNIHRNLRGVDLMEEVYNIIDRHLQLAQMSLDQIVRRDTDGRSWMDLRLDIEAVVNVMADDMLEEIIAEFMFK